MKKNIAQKSLEITGLFEAEVLVWLMLKCFQHPFADNREFVDDLLEDASEALRAASRGQQIIEGMPATSLNLVAAIWYAENCSLEEKQADPTTADARTAWLFAVRRTWPSCFCDPSDLPET